MTPTKDQTTGMIERVVYGIAMFFLAKLVAQGKIDGDTAAWLAGGAVTFAGGAYAWMINRPKALLVAAAASAPAGTKIVTTAEMANDTPLSPNIISAAENKVVPK